MMDPKKLQALSAHGISVNRIFEQTERLNPSTMRSALANNRPFRREEEAAIRGVLLKMRDAIDDVLRS